MVLEYHGTRVLTIPWYHYGMDHTNGMEMNNTGVLEYVLEYHAIAWFVEDQDDEYGHTGCGHTGACVLCFCAGVFDNSEITEEAKKK